MHSAMDRDGQQRVPETVRQAIIQVCRTAFHWKGDIKSGPASSYGPPRSGVLRLVL
jgi:hypothetical protein